jgi:hypothetical protein
MSPGDCAPAPDWLVAVLQQGIVVRGATLSNVFVVTASTFESGPSELQGDAFASAWWVAGKISGAGVRPEVALWLTNRTTVDQDGEIFAVDAAAQRYSHFTRPSQVISGPGMDEARDCVGPIPES